VQLQSAEPVNGGDPIPRTTTVIFFVLCFCLFVVPPHWGPVGRAGPVPSNEAPAMKRAVMSSEARG
jgi:hypothetical protein